jgi:preprotein translocase subunit SecE
VSLPEDERDGFTLGAGAVIGAASVVQVYRREAIRHWAAEVAAELGKVTWPNRETVVNGTLVVVLASAIATVYVAILDRFWSFLTTLVYGA